MRRFHIGNIERILHVCSREYREKSFRDRTGNADEKGMYVCRKKVGGNG